MKVGIVGHEAAKFTKETEESARSAIRLILTENQATHMVSGHSPLGGIDIWAEEEADKLGVEKLIFAPAENNWFGGYRVRNLQIAGESDIVFCIVVKELPEGYTGMVFPVCYHCAYNRDGFKRPHVKSGGCWTALKCKRRDWVVI